MSVLLRTSLRYKRFRKWLVRAKPSISDQLTSGFVSRDKLAAKHVRRGTAERRISDRYVHDYCRLYSKNTETEAGWSPLDREADGLNCE